MSQNDFGDLNASTESGSALAAHLNAYRTARDSQNSGTGRPGYAIAGTLWIKQINSNLWEIYRFDGNTDILEGRYNPTQHTFEPSFGAEATLASAATCDLGSLVATFLNITGTTGITSFGTGANLYRVLRFSGALSITHNATTLILLGGANRTTANGDVGIYRSDGSGNWREISYSSAAGAVSQGEASVASAATTDIGAANAQRVAITGTTGITSFGTTANALRFVRFAGALSITHNGTSLILKGGASRSVQAGDTGIYASDGSGNWRELAFMPADGGIIDTQEQTVASATTCDIGAATSPKVLITGTNTITGFGSRKNCMRFVRFGAALTLTYNATSLITRTGASRPIKAGDAGVYMSDNSGNWRELMFQPASQPKIFVQSSDPGSDAVDNDLWVW